MLNVGMMEGVNQASSKMPVEVISSDIRTLRDRNGNQWRMIRVVRHTLGRRIPAEW